MLSSALAEMWRELYRLTARTPSVATEVAIVRQLRAICNAAQRT